VKHDMGPDGQEKTSCIEYQENGDATNELVSIKNELEAAWQVEDVVLMLRVGCLAVHDIISLVAVSSPNSKESFAVCQEGLRRLKKMSTIVKKEYFG
jgi:molybdopterin synthase catalytic subunit